MTQTETPTPGPGRHPETKIPAADLQRFTVPLRRAVEVFQARADRLHARFEPVGADLERQNAEAIDDLLGLLDPAALENR